MRFGRDLAPLFAINFKVLSETVRVPHGPSENREALRSIRLASDFTIGHPNIAPSGINNSISKSSREDVRPLVNNVVRSLGLLVSLLFHTVLLEKSAS